MAYFDPGSVIWELQSTDKFDAISEIIHNAPVFTEHESLELKEFTRIVIEREKLQSTGFGHGVAVAHGRTNRVDEPTVALGISHEGIDFDSYDGEPVHLIFVVANHPDHQMDYLHILSTLVAMVRNELFRREILDCSRAEEAQQKLCSMFSRLMGKQRLTAMQNSA
ncbi:MAG: PTS sugar transporter subunit IIA [Spirochaetota bacterium]